MIRREFITLLGGVAAWPLAARAQQPSMPVIGLVRVGSRGQFPDLEDAFLQGLNQVGYVENQNVAIERRWAEGRLVSRRVAVIWEAHRRRSLQKQLHKPFQSCSWWAVTPSSSDSSQASHAPEETSQALPCFRLISPRSALI